MISYPLSAIVGQEGTTVTTASGLKIDAASRRVHLGERELALTAKEFDVLAVLASLMVSYTRARAEALGVECKVGIADRADAGERVVAIRGVGFRLETGA